MYVHTHTHTHRGRLDRKRPAKEEEEEEEPMDVGGHSDDPLASLVKRPRPMHADRGGEEEEEDSGDGAMEDQRDGEGARVKENDLRRVLKKKHKRRDLQLRLGYSPRVVEERL